MSTLPRILLELAIIGSLVLFAVAGLPVRRAAVAALLAAAALAGLTACAPDHGVIHAKAYTPAHTTWTTSCSLVGKVTVCHPIPIYEGPEWSFDLYASKDDHGWHDVDEHDYDTHQVGDYYGASR